MDPEDHRLQSADQCVQNPELAAQAVDLVEGLLYHAVTHGAGDPLALADQGSALSVSRLVGGSRGGTPVAPRPITEMQTAPSPVASRPLRQLVPLTTAKDVKQYRADLLSVTDRLIAEFDWAAAGRVITTVAGCRSELSRMGLRGGELVLVTEACARARLNSSAPSRVTSDGNSSHAGMPRDDNRPL
jgi:hypothetical protein